MKNSISKKQKLLKAAACLFTAQGFDATTTRWIVREAFVTEPLIYYHFKGKDDLFTRIIDAIHSEYFSLIIELEKKPDFPFGQIKKLIELQYYIAEEMPDEVQLIVNACSAKLKAPEDICAANVKEYRRRLMTYLMDCLSKGIEPGEFAPVPLEETATLILSVINGIDRYRDKDQGRNKNMREAAVDFC